MMDLVSAFPIIWPDRPDPNNPGKYLCRFCGKPTINSRRIYYCSDECYSNCYMAINWDLARQIVFKRDNGLCQMCGEKLYLYGEGEVESGMKWLRPEYHDEYRVYYEGNKKAETHHVIPCKDLRKLVFKITREIDDETLRRHRYLKTLAMLQLDINNLTTLCHKPCHDIVHSKSANLARKAKLNHKLLTEFIVQKTNESRVIE